MMIFALPFSLLAQTDSASIFDIDLEVLMNVKVITPSKKSESAFDAALTTASISKDEIQKAGMASIPEALRLIPGVIVRETTNGNYDVHIRGLDGLAPNSTLNNATNTVTLVMIDNRPVYNYFNGGTFWETLPVDLNDVERIEVVRGASSALYGPNAAAGVINIITKRLVANEPIFVVNNTYSNSTVITNTSAGFKKNKFSVIGSANYQNRKRSETNYYSWLTNTKVAASDIKSYLTTQPLSNSAGVTNVTERYPDVQLAQNKLGYNVFLNYDLDKETNKCFGLTAGGQFSTVQKPFIENSATLLTTSTSQTNYIDGTIRLGNLNAMTSYNGGTQNMAQGISGFKMDFTTIDANVEYDIKLLKLLTIKPGVNYRTATYDDTKYAEPLDTLRTHGFLNAKKTLSNIAGSLRIEFNPIEKLKFIAATRVDKYNHPSKLYTSYQFATSYKLTDNNIFRAVYSRSFRGPTFYDMYSNQSVPVGVVPVVGTMSLSGNATLLGNQSLSLLKIDLIELGYRTKLTDNFHVDIDAFCQKSFNYSMLVGGVNIISDDSLSVTIPQNISNLPLVAIQEGVTVSVNWVVNKIQFKPFVTVQKTSLNNVSRYRDAVTSSPINNILVTYNTVNHHTPTIYGGFYLNYQATRKVNINLSGYYFSNTTYENIVIPLQQQLSLPAYGSPTIKGKFLLNAKVNYKATEQLELYVNFRNALNQTTYEFAQTDKVDLMFLLGASINY